MFRKNRVSIFLLAALLVVFVLALSGGVRGSAAAQPVAAPTRALTLSDRIACHTAVEKVYWEHRIWPEVNPGPKPALAEVIAPGSIEAKADESLANSLALEQYWQHSVSGEMLQAELERIARDTRQPDVVEDIFAALNHDPLLAAECLARPLLAQRLLTNRFEQDERFSGQEFARWWESARPDGAVQFNEPAYEYRLPKVNGMSGNWMDTPSIPLDDVYGDVKGASVWTGTEMFFVGDFHTEAYLYDPATDSWRTATTLGGPFGLRDSSAVWTGTEVITWGGCTANNHNCVVAIGYRYDPVADTVAALPNAPIGRTDHSAVWTGSEMLVWGGCTYFNDSCQVYRDRGARFDPATDTWQTMSTANAPAGRTFPNLMWSGSEMLVWGGQSGAPANGGRYDPATDSWSSMSSVGAPIGTLSTAVWADGEMIAWGGCTGSPVCSTPHNTGGRYDPTTDAWTPTNTVNAPPARYWHGAVWTGDKMVAWGGYDGSSYLNSGGSYDPGTDSWTSVTSSGAPAGRLDHEMLWTGSLVLVWGGVGTADMRTGARYNPAIDDWSPISTNDPDSLRTYHSAVWTGVEMIAWGGVGDGTANSGLDSGRIYVPATNSWRATPLAGAPRGTWNASEVWTGTEMIVWSGQDGTAVPDTGGRFNPMSNTWSAMALQEGRTQNATVWTGTEMIVWGGDTWSSGWSNTGARYNPDTNTWTSMTTAGAPTGRDFPAYVWTGGEMLVWGGGGATGALGTGGRYDPATNSWSSMSNSGAPSARMLHSAVWTGAEMIVWGGTPDFSNFLDTGGRYNPTNDTWTATSTANAPIPAARHGTVWTGQEMVVWSGTCDENQLVTCHQASYEGGHYDPQTDSWTPTSLDGVPEAREWHSTVWTGQAMIVWGGIGTWSGYRHTGGMYFVNATPNNAPIANGDAYTATAGVELQIAAPGVLANDSDPDGDPLQAVLVSLPSDGVLTLNGDGGFSYTADSDFAGQDSFTYRASDGLAQSNTVSVTLSVEAAPNNAPIAVADSYTTTAGVQLQILAPGVLANDTDPDGDPLQAVLVTAPGDGQLTFNSDGGFTYTPDGGFIGVDGFSYKASDGLAESNTVSVTLNVIDTPNNAPVAVADVYTTTAGVELSISAPGVLANDSDPDGDALQAILVSTVSNGVLVLDADGSFTYLPNTGFSGTDSFTYLAYDGIDSSDAVIVTLVVEEATVYLFMPFIAQP